MGLLFLQLLTAVVALTLFGRTAPTVERIIDDNVRSLVAVEKMQKALILRASDDHARATFADALDQARANITAEEERAPIRSIEGSWRAAFDGDASSLRLVMASLGELSERNRVAIAASGAEAGRVTQAAGWAIVVLAGVGLGFGLLAVRRANHTVVEPIGRLHDAVEAYRGGEHLRRCEAGNAPREFRAIADALNALMDQVAAQKGAPEIRVPVWINRVLDEVDGPVAVVTPSAEVLASNVAGLAWLADEGAQEALRLALTGEPAEAVEIGDRAIFIRKRVHSV